MNKIDKIKTKKTSLSLNNLNNNLKIHRFKDLISCLKISSKIYQKMKRREVIHDCVLSRLFQKFKVQDSLACEAKNLPKFSLEI